jgi:predicted phosphoribosyltransferase
VAVPVTHREAYKIVEQESDKIIVLHISDLPYFAVASFYREFPDMSDQQVIAYLSR